MRWVRFGAAASDRHIVLAAVDLAEFAGNTVVVDADRAKFSRFVREVFGPRAKTLGFVPGANENDDDQLLRRSLLRFVGPEDPKLAAEARRLARAWMRDRKAVDPGLVDVVLITAGRTGDAALFDALLAEAKATQDRLERRYLMMALFAFTDPALAQKGLALLLDPTFDVRESWTALRNGYFWNPTRRATNDFIMANFDALANTVERDTPGGWPAYASGLCSESDRSKLAAFWKERARRYAGADRELANALEEIDLCARVRAANKRNGLNG
jgi:alanyl aminopeptidase